MTDLARDLERAVGVPVLDGVACAVALAEGVARLGLRTSKRNTYAAPLAKHYSGAFAPFSPRERGGRSLRGRCDRQPRCPRRQRSSWKEKSIVPSTEVYQPKKLSRQ
jgi:hypothetical protein